MYICLQRTIKHTVEGAFSLANYRERRDEKPVHRPRLLGILIGIMHQSIETPAPRPPGHSGGLTRL